MSLIRWCWMTSSCFLRGIPSERKILMPSSRSYKNWVILQDEMPGLQTTAPNDSLKPLKLGREVITKNKSSLGQICALRRPVPSRQACRKGSKEELVMLKGLVSASDQLTAKSAVSDRLLEAVGTEV